MSERFACLNCRYFMRGGKDGLPPAQCVLCESEGSFVAPEELPPTRDRVELDTEMQELGRRWFAPVEAHRGHPVLAWHHSVGNGFNEEDRWCPGFRSRDGVHRFTRDRHSAYAWQEGEGWMVRGWHPMRAKKKPPEPVTVATFGEALDRLMG